MRRLTIGNGFCERMGDIDVDDDGECGGVGTNGHVDNVRLIVSRWMILGENDDDDDIFLGEDGDEHKQ